MKKVFLTLAAALLLLPAGAEKIIAKAKDTVLSTEKSKAAIISHAFYVFKNVSQYRGKKVIFRMNVKRLEGSSPLGITFRCSTNPGNQLRVTRNCPFKYTKNGEKTALEFILDIPDLNNICH